MALHDPQPVNPRDAYIHAVRTFLPTCEGEELQLRCSIMLMRDGATERLKNCGEEAFGPLQHVQSMGFAYALSAMPLEALQRLRQLMADTIRLAAGFENWAMGRLS